MRMAWNRNPGVDGDGVVAEGDAAGRGTPSQRGICKLWPGKTLRGTRRQRGLPSAPAGARPQMATIQPSRTQDMRWILGDHRPLSRRLMFDEAAESPAPPVAQERPRMSS